MGCSPTFYFPIYLLGYLSYLGHQASWAFNSELNWPDLANSFLGRPVIPIYRDAHNCPQFFVDLWMRSNGKFFFILSGNIFSLIFQTLQFLYWTHIPMYPPAPLGFFLAPQWQHTYHVFSNSKSNEILPFGVSTASLPHHDILVFFSSISIKLPILRYRCSGEENSSLLSSLYTNSSFCSICFIHIPVFLYKEFSSSFGPSNFARKCTQKPLSRVSFSFPFPTSSANPYRMLKQSEGFTKRKRPQKGSSSDNTTCTLVSIVDDFATDEFKRDLIIPDNVDIQLLHSTTPLLTNTHKKHFMCFTKEQFHVRLHLPLPSLVREVLHYTQISPSFVHLNSIHILMGCSILNQLFNLKLSLLEIFFIYTIKLNKWGKFLISAYIRQLQLITNLSDFAKDQTIRHVIVSRERKFSTPDPHGPYPLNHTLKLPSKHSDTSFFYF